jgi:hypothetical protein
MNYQYTSLFYKWYMSCDCISIVKLQYLRLLIMHIVTLVTLYIYTSSI